MKFQVCFFKNGGMAGRTNSEKTLDELITICKEAIAKKEANGQTGIAFAIFNLKDGNVTDSVAYDSRKTE